MPFERLPGAMVFCDLYGSGGCCYDIHFDMSEVLPERDGITACNQLIQPDRHRRAEDGLKTTTDKRKVNCKECREMIHG